MPDVLVNNRLVCALVFTVLADVHLLPLLIVILVRKEQIQQKFIMNLLNSRQYANIQKP